MGDAAEELALTLARSSPQAGQTMSARVADLTEDGRVNLELGNGDLLLGVACADSYQYRQVGDWVAVRLGARPVVMWRLGDDPANSASSRLQETVEGIVDDLIAVSALTWDTGAPGAGWQAVTQLYVKKDNRGVGQLYAQVASVTDPSPTATTRAPKTVTISPTSSGAWRSGRRDDYRDNPFQGVYSGRPALRGGWFYGSAISNACSGKTVASMKVSFTRKKGSGVYSKRPLHLYLHDHSSPPSGQLDLDEGPEELLSLSVGATGTATLPSSWRTKLADGTRKGLAIYYGGTRDYMSVTGGKITITFSA